MKALLLIAHGSRKVESCEEIAQLASQVTSLPSEYEEVRHCFLELVEPKVASSIDELVALGCEDITLFPYFLAAGFHVANDLPKLLQEAQQKHPHVIIKLKEHFGASKQMPQWILQSIKAD